jgi:hypothetical protein
MAEWYDNQNMGSAFPLLDYGANKLANYASNALSNNQNNYSRNQNNTGLFDYRNALGDNWATSSAPLETIPSRVNTTYPQNVNFYDDSEHYPITPDAEKTGIWGSLKNKLGNIPFPSIAHLINKTTRPGANLSFAGYPDGTASRAGLYATEVANMQKLADMGRLTAGGKDRISGKNVVSGFGNYKEGMQKSLERFKETAAAHEKAGKFKGYGEDEDPLDKLAAYYKAQYGPVRGNAVLQRLKHAQQMTGSDSREDVSTTKITAPAGDQITQGGGGDSGFNPTFDQPSSSHSEPTWHEATAARDTVAGPGFGSGAYWAQGGRVGYNRGRVVNPGGYAGMSMFEAWLKDQYGMGVRDIKDWNLYAGLSREWNRLGGSKADGGIAGLL